MSQRPMLYICAPYATATKAEKEERDKAIREAIRLGWAPVYGPYAVGEATREKVPGEREAGLAVCKALVGECAAFLIVGKRETAGMKAEALEWDHARGFGFQCSRPIRGIEHLKEAALPFADAAVKVENVTGWKCATCNRFWGSDERFARLCHAATRLCERCTAATSPNRIYCEACDEERVRAYWEKKKTGPWNGHMLFSELLDEWFTGTDDAEDRAREMLQEEGSEDLVPGTDEPTPKAIREQLRAMRLLQSEPVHGPWVDIQQHLSDSMPEEDSGYELADYAARVKDEVDALNAAIVKLGPLSYQPTDLALDVETLHETPGHPNKYLRPEPIADPIDPMVEGARIAAALMGTVAEPPRVAADADPSCSQCQNPLEKGMHTCAKGPTTPFADAFPRASRPKESF